MVTVTHVMAVDYRPWLATAEGNKMLGDAATAHVRIEWDYDGARPDVNPSYEEAADLVRGRMVTDNVHPLGVEILDVQFKLSLMFEHP